MKHNAKKMNIDSGPNCLYAFNSLQAQQEHAVTANNAGEPNPNSHPKTFQLRLVTATSTRAKSIIGGTVCIHSHLL